ncbi:MAG TPA: hypothetical protein VFC78_01125 [Tepidisphaeraceae bacterium]|nr:hypothetical protein [Tepidisphaeraceae bacterium]
MYEDAGKPRIGDDTCELGVRFAGHRINVDVIVDASGNVVMDGGGMSVFPSIVPADLKRIPKRLIPLRFANRIPGAIGDDDMKIWTMGAGPFVSEPVSATLTLNVTGRSHGLICPAHAMSLTDLQTELARTQPDWAVEEP